MGDITEKRRRDYSGLDADKASIPAGGKAVSDTFLATDTKILYFWDGVAWIIIPLDVIVAGMIKTDAVETLKIKDLNVTKGKAELGFGRYVPRVVNAWDKQIGDFTTDGTVKVDGLDLSGIVPAGAIAVALNLVLKDDAADSYFYIYHSAAGTFSGLRTRTVVANIERQCLAIVPIDTNRLMDYDGKNLAFTSISLAVTGWII